MKLKRTMEAFKIATIMCKYAKYDYVSRVQFVDKSSTDIEAVFVKRYGTAPFVISTIIPDKYMYMSDEEIERCEAAKLVADELRK